MATGDKIVNVDGLKAVHDRDERAIAVKYRTADTDFDYGELKVGGINKDNAYTSGTNQRRVETYWPVIDDEITIQMSGGLTGYLRLYDSNKTMIDPDASLPGANTTNHYVLIGKDESLTLRMKDYNVNAAYFRFTMSSGTQEIAEALIPENARFIMPKNVATQEDVDELQNKNMPNIWGLFRNAVCIGDSLTRGYLSAYASKERNRDYGYPSALARLTGMNVWNYGLSGSDPGEWAADATMAAQDYSKFDVAFVSFGQNIDKSGGGSYTESEYEELYMSVLQRLKTANSNMVIFCLSNPGPRAVNGWIQDFVATATNQSGTYAYQYVYYLDVSTDAPYTSHRTDGTHLDALGYSMLAECVKIAVEKLYAQNPTAVYIPKTVDNIITKPVNPPCLLEDKVEDIEDSVRTMESDVSDLKSAINNVPTIAETNEAETSLDLADFRGYVVARFKNGHIQTKNFDSAIEKPTGSIEWKVSGSDLLLAYGYNAESDAVVVLNRGRANNLFDFAKLCAKPKSTPLAELETADLTVIWSNSTDMHGPFQFNAANNADGYHADAAVPSWVGGNHTLDQMGAGFETATSKFVEYFADSTPVSSGYGKCTHFEIRWANDVQAYNTVKQGGGGRSCLTEYHDMIFDGIKFDEIITLIPSEEITMALWYGLQLTALSAVYPNMRYTDATNRNVYTGSSSSGNRVTSGMTAYGSAHAVDVTVDITCDLGTRPYYSSTGTEGAFSNGSKAYFSIIRQNVTMDANDAYYLKGSYRFYPVIGEVQ